MKKTLVSALTTALVVGAASTTFAAANPFSDVPADHWAYDAVQQLAQDGVVEGYGDATFRGQQNITRYEMAQMIAKAMAKADTSAADKALIDKLAAEFSDELKNLGVRVANLESKVDNVKWDGFVRYDYTKRNVEHTNNNMDGRFDTAQRIWLRLNTTMEINKNWTGHARIEHAMSTNTGMSNSVGVNKNGFQENVTRVNLAYVEGKYGTTSIKLGRFGTFDDATHGMQMDDKVAGAEVIFGQGKAVSFKVTAGRGNANADDPFSKVSGWNGQSTASLDRIHGYAVGNGGYGSGVYTYIAAEVDYHKGKFDAGLGTRRYNGRDMASQYAVDGETLDRLGSWNLGAGYRFDKNAYLTFDYAHAIGVDEDKLKDSNRGSSSYNIQFNYKGANPAKRGSYGLFLAYRKLGNAVSFAPTYDDAMYSSQKGWAVGGTYVFAKNITGYIDYFWGKDYNSKLKQNRLVGQLTFLF